MILSLRQASYTCFCSLACDEFSVSTCDAFILVGILHFSIVTILFKVIVGIMYFFHAGSIHWGSHTTWDNKI